MFVWPPLAPGAASLYLSQTCPVVMFVTDGLPTTLICVQGMRSHSGVRASPVSVSIRDGRTFGSLCLFRHWAQSPVFSECDAERALWFFSAIRTKRNPLLTQLRYNFFSPISRPKVALYLYLIKTTCKPNILSKGVTTHEIDLFSKRAYSDNVFEVAHFRDSDSTSADLSRVQARFMRFRVTEDTRYGSVC